MNGGVKSYPIDKVRMDACSLQTRFIDELVQLQDCSRKKCRIKKLPKGLNALNALKYLRQVPIWKLYKIGRKYMKNARVGKLKVLGCIEGRSPSLTGELGLIMFGPLRLF